MRATKEGLVGRKVGMTQLFGKDGNVIPATVLKAGPCTVVQVKTADRDGYDAIQLGFEEVKKNVAKPRAGHFKKAGVPNARILRELRLESVANYQVGQKIGADLFTPGELVDVTGVSKGKGFQGGIKRHGWSGGGATHGSMFHRAPGSIGASSDPSRVFKGHRLPGRMGGEQRTTQNLEVIRVVPEQNLLVVKGAIPGSIRGVVLIRKSVKKKKSQKAP
jgi:large subunit ribosomal protein L3